MGRKSGTDILFFAFIALIASCTSRNENAAQTKPTPTACLEDSMYVFPMIFETAFCQGYPIAQNSQVVTFTTKDAGLLNVETGKLIAIDPINMSNAQPFEQNFPKGKFPAQLAVIHWDGSESGRVAFARISFSDELVKEWKMANVSGQKAFDLKSDSIYGFTVDASTAMFIDEAANKAFNAMYNEELYNDAFISGLKEEPEGVYNNLFEFSGHNLAAFSTGQGDGLYATYIGYDKNNEPCRLLIDFDQVNWKEE